MSAARLASAIDADFTELGEERRGDRRAQDRRAPRMKLEPLFAATLVNHVAKPEAVRGKVYGAPAARLRAGVVVNVSA